MPPRRSGIIRTNLLAAVSLRDIEEALRNLAGHL
jgi:hypothetical protein